MKLTVQVVVKTERPPAAIEKVLLDSEKTALWTSVLERCEVLTRPPGLVGSKARLHYRQGGRCYVIEDELLAWEPQRRYLSRVTGDAIAADVETTLTPTSNGTRVEVQWHGSGKPILLRLLLPLMRGSIARQTKEDLLKLKAIVEVE